MRSFLKDYLDTSSPSLLLGKLWVTPVTQANIHLSRADNKSSIRKA
jgi:hypothetical protein